MSKKHQSQKNIILINTKYSQILFFLIFNSIFNVHYQIQSIKVLFKFDQHLSKKRVFFGLVSMPKLNRQSITYQYWMKELYRRGVDDVAFITKPSDVENLTAKYIHPTEEDNKIINPSEKADTDRGMKRVLGAKYFVNHSNYAWYWSMTDDVLVDLNALDMMMNEFSMKYDTEKDIVMKGHLYTYFSANKTYIYPQGGSGFLMSKAAVHKFLSFGVDWAKKLKWPEDIYGDFIIKKLNISYQSVMTPYMYGNANVIFPIPKKIKNCEDTKICPSLINKTMTVSDLTPLKKLVAIHYHSSRRNSHIKTMNEIKRLKACKNLYYYINITRMYICKINKK